jgi:Xaa-Pro aminopeptidase
LVLAVERKLISPDFGAVNIADDVVVTAGTRERLNDSSGRCSSPPGGAGPHP